MDGLLVVVSSYADFVRLVAPYAGSLRMMYWTGFSLRAFCLSLTILLPFVLSVSQAGGGLVLFFAPVSSFSVDFLLFLLGALLLVYNPPSVPVAFYEYFLYTLILFVACLVTIPVTVLACD
ncbi:hypothetical protein [Butyrivibrio proteoclasticus]|uniref:hypothetical protein n=1 Tax=Butyrivibrio proteoclasticus TaxID=43305 RepID=UPI001A9960DE|nr:hypothetical protein [Butyrivibrio proteoclasticus]